MYGFGLLQRLVKSICVIIIVFLGRGNMNERELFCLRVFFVSFIFSCWFCEMGIVMLMSVICTMLTVSKCYLEMHTSFNQTNMMLSMLIMLIMCSRVS